MPRYAARPLSVRRVQTLSTPGLYCDGGGLYLKVNPTGSKSWIFRYQAGKRKIGIGSVNTFGLAEARDRARKMRQLVADGIDPIDMRPGGKPAIKALTFGEAAERYVVSHEAGWKGGGAPWLGSLAKHAFPVFGDQPVAAIDVAMVMAVLEPRWAKQAVRMGIVRGRIEAVLDWARARGMREGENPARWKGHLANLLPQVKRVATIVHRAAMPYAEVGAFMVELRALSGVAARVLEYQILCAARSGEVVRAHWDEINLVERVWTIPAERMKAKIEHRVPLSDAAIAVLLDLQAVRESDFIFPGQSHGRPIHIEAPMRAIRALGHTITAHGFRSTFRDWAAEQTNFPREIAEASLAHLVGDAVERAYRRGDFLAKRRQLMDAWARYLAQPTAASAQVIAIRRKGG